MTLKRKEILLSVHRKTTNDKTLINNNKRKTNSCVAHGKETCDR